MTQPSFRVLLVAGLALPLAMASASLAQTGPYGPPPGPPGRDGRPPPADSPVGLAQQMRDALHLRADQEDALRAFVEAVTPPPGATERMRQAQQADQALPTPARLDRMLAHMDEMRGLMAARVTATKRFYAQLSPEQRRTFDTLRPPGR